MPSECVGGWSEKQIRPMQTEERKLWTDTFTQVLQSQPAPHIGSAASQADEAVRRFKFGPPKTEAEVVAGSKD